ncbi:MAG: Hsp70 family protein [Acidimicrobiia bacterium]|nr:Hsp70 family protein [Acidimicrobiia bacterium]
MSYALGIDVGTTFTAAAVYRDGASSIVQLGTHRSAVPSVVVFRGDDTVLTGDAAERRSRTEPDRVAREFKRRFGDETPMFIGGTPRSPEMITARLLRDVVDSVTEREGGPPTDGIAITHPASWGEYKLGVLQQAVRLAGLSDVTLLSEPIAAAVHYASLERVPDDAIIAVYDLGGGTFDAAAVQKRQGEFEILGQPEGIERLGGVDFDAAVLQHVRSQLGDRLDELDPTGTEALRLRDECVAAKEALSTDSDATISVLVGGDELTVRLTRTELESMIQPVLVTSIEAMDRALQSAAVTPSQLYAVLLVGGGSRIPLVAELVGNAFARPVAVDVHPKHSIALGAARFVAESRGAAAVAPPPPYTQEVPVVAAAASSGGRGRMVGAIAGIVAVASLGVVAFAAFGGGDSDSSDTGSTEATPAPTTAAPTTAAPTTAAPTTAAPATVAPASVAPATVAPATVAPVTVAVLAVPPTTTIPGDLGLATLMTRPDCDGQNITIVASLVAPSVYRAEVSAKLAEFPGSAYLRTAVTCPSLRAQFTNGSDIYVVYFGPFARSSQACEARIRGAGDAYVKNLSFSLPPNHEVSCS